MECPILPRVFFVRQTYGYNALVSSQSATGTGGVTTPWPSWNRITNEKLVWLLVICIYGQHGGKAPSLVVLQRVPFPPARLGEVDSCSRRALLRHFSGTSPAGFSLVFHLIGYAFTRFYYSEHAEYIGPDDEDYVHPADVAEADLEHCCHAEHDSPDAANSAELAAIAAEPSTAGRGTGSALRTPSKEGTSSGRRMSGEGRRTSGEGSVTGRATPSKLGGLNKMASASKGLVNKLVSESISAVNKPVAAARPGTHTRSGSSMNRWKAAVSREGFSGMNPWNQRSGGGGD